MKYTECLERIDETAHSIGIVPGLDTIKELCQRLGNPQDKLKFVHIAGTNGKGSCLAFISSILKEAGYKTGCYCSPVIRDYRERFTINGRMISMKAMCGYMERIFDICDDMVADGFAHPSAFEIETAVAFCYFLDKACDVVVLEAGMGGKLDATNVVKTTSLAVLTSISMDHMAYLGDTLTRIAENKCGIIKPHAPVVSMYATEEISEVTDRICAANETGCTYVDRDSIKNVRYGAMKQYFEYRHIRYATSLLGTYQIDNAVLAIEAAEALMWHGFDRITSENIQKGLASATWPARFLTVCKKPRFIIDGAHNDDAAKRLRESIDIFAKDKKKIYIVGMFRDKEVEKVISRITGDGELVFTCAAVSARAMKPIELAEIVRNTNPRVTACDSVNEAVEFAMAAADEDTVIIAFGSLAYLGTIMDIFGIK